MVAIFFWGAFSPVRQMGRMRGPMPQPLRKMYPGLDLDRAQEQVRVAMKRAIDSVGKLGEFTEQLNARLLTSGHEPVTTRAVYWWSTEGTLIDKRYWPHIEAITDMATTRRHLRPDIYGFDQP